MEASEEEWVNPKTTKARFVRYAIIQSLQCFLELTHSSSEASKSKGFNIEWKIRFPKHSQMAMTVQ